MRWLACERLDELFDVGHGIGMPSAGNVLEDPIPVVRADRVLPESGVERRRDVSCNGGVP